MTRGPAEIALGPILIGTVLNVLFYGIMITQVYLYHTSQKRDGWLLQAFIYFLFLGDTVHTVFTVIYVYQALINHFGDLIYLSSANWIFATDAGLTGMLGGCVQGFFAWRVKVLTGNLILVSLILLCSTSAFLMGVATAISIRIVPQFAEFQRFKVVVIIWLGSASLADLLITVTLVTYLKRHKTGFATTDGHVDRIIRLTMQTGLLTAIVALVDLLAYLLEPSAIHLIFNLMLSKLYTNSLLSSLNARKGWRYDSDSTAATINSLSFNQSTSPGTEVFLCVESHEMVTSDKSKQTMPSSASQWDVESQKKNQGLAV